MSTTEMQTEHYGFGELAGSIHNFDEQYSSEINSESYFSFPIKPVFDIEQSLRGKKSQSIAYFSMEYGIAPSIYNSFQLAKPMAKRNQFYTHEVFSNYWLCDYLFKIHIDKMLDIPIYGGGLGVLAGDAMKSSADLGYSVAGIGILWNKGYFKQNFWYKHGQVPEELSWDPNTYPGLIPLKDIVTIDTVGGPIHLRLWKYYVYSFDRQKACPIILLDSNLNENKPEHRKLTDQLYRSDDVWWKICQRMILGIGGMKALDQVGYVVNRYHLNEGHAAFALAEYTNQHRSADKSAIQAKFAYTCHTPVEAGHDRFSVQDIEHILTDEYAERIRILGAEPNNKDLINLTHMCMENCGHVNAVAEKHGEITRLQFPDFKSKIKSITNGVHLHTWLSDSFEQLFDRWQDTFGDWRGDESNLKNILKIKNEQKFRKEMFDAHQANKKNLINVLERWQLDENILTVGWARRIAGYKRPALIFHQVQQIIDIASKVGPIQIILAGKAHPNDDIGSAHIEEILDHIDQLNEYKQIVKVLILENYDTYFGKLLTNSVDIWLNNPLPPFEASGTSGMKAIMNGVLQMSTLDGWVVEAEHDDIGWIFGSRHEGAEIGHESSLKLDEDSQALYETLTKAAELYYETNKAGEIQLNSPWIDKMINCVAISGFFNTQRMMQNYKETMWQI